MILEGGTSMYQKMYENALGAMKKYIFYRPMVSNGKNILFSAKVRAPQRLENMVFEYEAQHLGCFAGGMVGIGAKIFSKDEDLNLAWRLMEGCLWAYENMPQGIMPEILQATPCAPVGECEWNETTWFETVRNAFAQDPRVPKGDDPVMSLIQNFQLPKGIVKVHDPRYILRSVTNRCIRVCG
jgi:mannosyl-oligosaccharide alpha-1,2-mannosidase